MALLNKLMKGLKTDNTPENLNEKMMKLSDMIR